MVVQIALSLFLLLASAAIAALDGLQSLSAQSGGSDQAAAEESSTYALAPKQTIGLI